MRVVQGSPLPGRGSLLVCLLRVHVPVLLPLTAKDKKKFFGDFTAAFTKLEELGTKGLYAV